MVTSINKPHSENVFGNSGNVFANVMVLLQATNSYKNTFSGVNGYISPIQALVSLLFQEVRQV